MRQSFHVAQSALELPILPLLSDGWDYRCGPRTTIKLIGSSFPVAACPLSLYRVQMLSAPACLSTSKGRGRVGRMTHSGLFQLGNSGWAQGHSGRKNHKQTFLFWFPLQPPAHWMVLPTLGQFSVSTAHHLTPTHPWHRCTLPSLGLQAAGIA